MNSTQRDSEEIINTKYSIHKPGEDPGRPVRADEGSQKSSHIRTVTVSLDPNSYGMCNY